MADPQAGLAGDLRHVGVRSNPGGPPRGTRAGTHLQRGPHQSSRARSFLRARPHSLQMTGAMAGSVCLPPGSVPLAGPPPQGGREPRVSQCSCWELPSMALPSQSLKAEGSCAQASPTFHLVLLLQLDTAEVRDTPQGDVEALGHAHFQAVQVHLELSRDWCEPGTPGPLPTQPSRASCSSQSWSPGPRTEEEGCPFHRPGVQDRLWVGRPGAGRGAAAGAQQRLGAGPAGPGQALASPAAPPAAVGRHGRPARSDTVSPGCPGSWSRPLGPEGSLGKGRGASDHGGGAPSPPPLCEVRLGDCCALSCPWRSAAPLTMHREGGVHEQEQRAAAMRGASHGG